MEPTSDDTVPSPCVRNCCLDEASVCMGCGRALEEIIEWSRAPPEERRRILERAKSRLRARAAADSHR
jgi:predicted Fe-S protein YdhL (DUF1289 family)